MKKYIGVLFGIIATALLVVIGVSEAAVIVTDSLNDRYKQLYMEKATGVSAPWYDEGYHIVDSRFINELSRMKKDNMKKVISVGSSVSIIGFNEEEAAKDEEYVYRFMTCGNGGYRSDGILYDLLKEKDVIGEDDIIKLEMSFSTFRDVSTTITETFLDKWDGLYINTCLIRIQSLWDLFMDYMDQVRHGSHGIGLTERAGEFGVNPNGQYDAMKIPGNFRNNYYNPEAVVEDLEMTEDMQREYEELILEIGDSHKLVVELSPVPPNIASTDYGISYNEYIDDRLIPLLEENGIGYVDYRNDYTQDEYADGVHLGYEAGLNYTVKIMEDMHEY